MQEPLTVRTLEVRRNAWQETRIVEEELPTSLADGEVVLRVLRLALTANNISYATAGEMLGYWGFFPAEEGWGRIPAMGWGEVVASAHPEIEEGELVWGFFPYSTHLKITAGDVSQHEFHDRSAHRAEYAPVYARFERAAASPLYDPAREDHDSLLRGLFMTSWLVEDSLQVNGYLGAGACLVTSASSKTSIALAWCLKRRGAVQSVGITSPGNAAFCASLGCYDRVVVYDDLTSLDASQAVVMVDMAGSAAVVSALHHHFGDNMKQSLQVGATHHDEAGDTTGLPGAKPEFFFAPGHIQTRSAELGAEQLMLQLGSAYIDFREDADDWLHIVHSRGPAAVQQAYLSVLAGQAAPSDGQIVSLWDE